ncbi:hypothetical protein WMY93_017602 [Mugilogobius chulae]|uniref:Signal recognition particle 14 kDa protein n=1 Tax=Mugilogobius chulae TaxID=88201 RepID=A0AAW0NNQ7_9GOBI
MVLLENDSFLTELTRLFQKCRSSGSVVITLKKYDGRTKPVPRKGHSESFEPADNKCLIRASDGKKKISTVVSTKEVIKFQMAYSNLLRAHMDGLKKKDKKSKSKKTKATHETDELLKTFGVPRLACTSCLKERFTGLGLDVQYFSPCGCMIHVSS